MDFKLAKEYVLERLAEELPDNLYYHNSAHTLDVLAAAELIAQTEKVSGEELVLLKTAALYHDTGFIRQYEANEGVACDIARETLPRFGYTKKQIDQVCHIIMGTVWPHNPSCLLQRIICDADLFYLGTERFPEISGKLREELAAQGTRMSDREWLDLEIRFLENQRFFTGAGRRLREQLKIKLLDELKTARV